MPYSPVTLEVSTNSGGYTLAKLLRTILMYPCICVPIEWVSIGTGGAMGGRELARERES